MKWIICDGTKRLFVQKYFESVEDCIDYLKSQWKFIHFHGAKVRSYVVNNWYSFIGYLENVHNPSHNVPIDFMIYGMQSYDKEEKI